MPNGQPRRQLDASRAEELFGFRARTPLREGLERTVAWYRAPLPRMPLADRLRAAGTRTGPFLVGAIVVQWLSVLAVAAFEANHVGWRFEQSTDALASIQGAFGLVNGDLPREGPGILWPIVLSPVASVADTMDGVLAGAVLLNVLVLAPVALVAAYWVAARLGGRLLGAWTVVLWLSGRGCCYVLALARTTRSSATVCCRSSSA